jgi:carboxymethylenebutenolidase
MDPHAIRLYDSYAHGGITRRVFLDRLTEFAGSTAAATALLALLRNDYAQAAVVAPDDPRLAVDSLTFDAAGTELRAMAARLKGSAKRPAVVVIHENRGLNPHIEDVTRRFALEGFLALGVDMLSPLGGTPADEEQARGMIASLKPEETVARLTAAVRFAGAHAEATGKVGAVGFCWGGGMVNRLAAASPELDAGVAYYGTQISAEDVAKIRAPLMLHYAGLDERINAGIPAYEAALKAAAKRYTLYVYPNVNHAFNNDTGPARYDKAAADLAWSRTIAFFRETLAGART